MIEDRESRGTYYSKFGGLWIDDVNPKNVEDRIERIADADLRQKVRNFARDGYVVMPGAIPDKTIDAYLQEYERAADTPDFLIVDLPLNADVPSREKKRACREPRCSTPSCCCPLARI